MKKLLILILAALVLSGCGYNYLEITTEQQRQIVEYSAGLLLKYDHYYDNGLVDIALPTPEPEVITVLPEAEPDEDTAPDPNAPQIVDNTIPSLPQSMTEIIGISGLDFRYAGIEVTPEYPAEMNPEEIAFIVDAAIGQNLLVVKFEAVNTSGSDIYLDMLAQDLRVRIGYNDKGISATLRTFLLNDLTHFQGDIPAGETVLLVSICEVPISTVGEVSSIQYIVISAAGNVTLEF
jgi:hypothetical protein